MKSIGESVTQACDEAIPLSTRHEAFRELVIRFQDMAFACAFATLGDAYLAEDVAQDAFITAWHKLTQLREPDAFPGWFKRIVLTQCNRLLRGKRLQFVSPESMINKPAPGLGPEHVAERQQLVDRVLKAISELPEKQRLVTILFYVNGYTQEDIGQFLDLPISTVNKRLYSARLRLKEGVAEMVKSDLDQRRPSRNHDFSNEVSAKLRPLSNDDWTSISTLAFARVRRDAPGRELWLSRRQNFDDSRYLRRQYVAEDDAGKRILGYGSIEQSIYLPRYMLFLVASPRWLQQGVGDLLLERLLEDLRQAKPITVSCREYSSKTELIALLKQRGFEEVATQLDSRLMLAQAEISSLSSCLKPIEKTGITVSTLAQERACDPRCVKKLYDLNVALLQQTGQSSFKPPSYNPREALLWLDMPYVLPDGYFIAKDGDRYVGVIDVSLHDSLPGGVTLGAAGVLPEYRRKGIGTALTLHAIHYAKTHDYNLMRTFNRACERSLLKLNAKAGFKTEFKVVTLEKCLRNVATIDSPSLYDEYAGIYQAERPDSKLDIDVRNEKGRLTLECIGQKVELFPASQTNFFIKPFYGEVTFVRDVGGHVGHLDFVQYNADSIERFKALLVPKTNHSPRSKNR